MKSHLAALAGALLLIAPSAAFAQAGSKGTVKVGVLLPLTGNTAWAGKTNRIAATIAAEEAGVPWVMAGDCNNVPGDLLTAIRDASMIAWAAEEKFPTSFSKVRLGGMHAKR